MKTEQIENALIPKPVDFILSEITIKKKVQVQINHIFIYCIAFIVCLLGLRIKFNQAASNVGPAILLKH